MKIKKANIKRLASLSALGAGTLGVTAGTAEASSIVYSGIIDEKVGFGRGFASKGSFCGALWQPHRAESELRHR